MGVTVATYKQRKRTVELSFSLQKKGSRVLFGRKGVNCDCRGGGLRSGIGSDPVLKSDGSAHTCPVDNAVLLVARKDLDRSQQRYTERFGVLNDVGEFYLQETLEGEYYCLFTGMEHANFAQFAGRDDRFVLALIGNTRCTYVYQDNTFDYVILQNMSRTGCFHRHRMFLGELPATLACSAPESIMDFAESIHDGGLVRFPNVGGEIVAIKGYRGRLYLFFERGILRLNASGAVKNFTVDEVPYSGGKIYGRTVCAGDKALYFLAADGAYALDGTDVKRVLSHFVRPAKEETLLERGAAYAGRILFRYLTEEGYRTLVFYEDDESGYYMDGLPIFTDEEGGRCLFIDENKTIRQLAEGGERGPDGLFESAECELGRAGRKILTDLHFEGRGSFSLTVKTGGRTLKREVVFREGAARVRASESGEAFTFSIRLPYGSEISSMSATYTTVTGG